MTTTASHAPGTHTPQWFSEDSCRLEDFIAVVGKKTKLEDYAYADAVEQNVLIYGQRLHNYMDSPEAVSYTHLTLPTT